MTDQSKAADSAATKISKPAAGQPFSPPQSQQIGNAPTQNQKDSAAAQKKMSPMPLEEAFSPIFVARQPIFDLNNNIWGYELLFRSNKDTKVAMIGDHDAATAQVIVEGFSMATVNEVDRKYLINFPTNLLLKGSALALPPNNCVVEILETVTPTPQIIESCHKLKNAGYTLALDDFVDQAGMDPLLAMADIVKVDMAQLSVPEFIKLTQRLQRWHCALLAEKVENNEMYRLAKTMGYKYFQGFFFSKPKLIEGRTLSTESISKIRLLKEMSKGDFDVTKLTKIITNDISLSYRLIKYINSAYHGLLHEVTSIQQAIILLGFLPLQHWLLMVILSDLAVTPATKEISFLSVKRSKFLELLGKEKNNSQAQQDTLFMLGLFSKLDSLMGMPMAELLPSLPLDAKIKDALAKKEENELSPWLTMLDAVDNGKWTMAAELLTKLGIDLEKAAMLHAQALNWTRVNLDVVSANPKTEGGNS